MLLNEEQLRKSVAFLWIEKQDEERPGKTRRSNCGTAFFVAVPLATPREYEAVYAVTARHVITNSAPHGTLQLRVNLKGGGARDFAVPQDGWATHPTTDVAVTSVPFEPDWDVRWWRPDDFVRDGDQISQLFRAGDDVIFAGLYSPHPGEDENEPILRFGNIALMPREPVWVRLQEHGTRKPIGAVLVEARSWGGQSGSPAIVDRSRYGGPGPRLLGLVHGHDEIPTKIEIQHEERGEVGMNAGIAIVVPAQKILETLMQEDVAGLRREAERLSSAAGGPLQRLDKP